MTLITDIAQRFKTFPVDKVITDTINEYQTEIVSLNSEKQLFEQGVDSKGNVITPEYADSTKKIKARKGQPVDRVTLKDKGDFHKSFMVKVFQNQFQIDSKDPKKERLIKKYGPEILGLTQESESAFSQTRVKTELQNELKKWLKV